VRQSHQIREHQDRVGREPGHARPGEQGAGRSTPDAYGDLERHDARERPDCIGRWVPAPAPEAQGCSDGEAQVVDQPEREELAGEQAQRGTLLDPVEAEGDHQQEQQAVDPEHARRGPRPEEQQEAHSQRAADVQAGATLAEG
jgi:hypothetical protein